MKSRIFFAFTLALALGSIAVAQDPGASPQGQNGGRAGRGWGGMMGSGRGNGVIGTVSAVAADHYTVKSQTGETYTVHFSVNTRVMKQPPQVQGRGMGQSGNPPQTIKSSDIKVGDVIIAGGEVDEAAKSVGAVFVMQFDPERAKQMREMQANFGKTWLLGRVTAVNETRVTLESPVDKASHTFEADENTAFRKRREPITLADVQVGDSVRVEGALKSGVFLATSVSVMMPPASGGPAPRHGEPAQ